MQAHRRLANYSTREKIARAAWGFAQCFFRWSPRLLYPCRNFLLRLFGAKIGHSVRIYPSVQIFAPWNLCIGNEVTIGHKVRLYALATIEIGARTVLSQGAHLCAGSHDYTRTDFPLLAKPIRIGNDAWIAAEAFIGPGVTLGDGCIAGARAVVMKSLHDGAVAAGNPARIIKVRPRPW